MTALERSVGPVTHTHAFVCHTHAAAHCLFLLLQVTDGRSRTIVRSTEVSGYFHLCLTNDPSLNEKRDIIAITYLGEHNCTCARECLEPAL